MKRSAELESRYNTAVRKGRNNGQTALITNAYTRHYRGYGKDYAARVVYVLRHLGFSAYLNDEDPDFQIVRSTATRYSSNVAEAIAVTKTAFIEWLEENSLELPDQPAREPRSDIDKSVDRIRAASVRQFADWVAGVRSTGDTMDLEELRILVNAFAGSVEDGEL